MIASDYHVAMLRRELATHSAAIATALLGEPNRQLSSKRQLRFGRKGSVVVEIDGPKVGLWHDHENCIGGDLLYLIKRVRGVGFHDAISYAKDFIGRGSRHRSSSPQSSPNSSSSDHDNRACALILWNEAESISGTLATAYLDRRQVLEPALAATDSVLRFHGACPFGLGARHPCILALLRDIRTDEPCAIHRTALTPTGEKIGRKLLGQKSGAAIKLCPDAAVTIGLAIAEGIETALSGIQLGWRPTWSVVDAAGISNFPVLPGIEALMILVDNDESGAGQRSAKECSGRWTAANREVLRVIPRCPGADLNDVARKRVVT